MATPKEQQTIVLPNGLKVVLVERPFGKGFTASLNFLVGSQDDPPKSMGLAHLTEHLCFTGTTRELSRELTQQSVAVNAYTTSQRTAFYVSGHKDFLSDGLRLLASILEFREIDSDACQHEREIIHQEMVDHQPDTLFERTAAYWKLSDRIFGDPNWRSGHDKRLASVRKLTSDAVNRFRKEFYRPDNGALSIVAPCGLGELRSMVEDLLRPVASGEGPTPKKVRPCIWKEAPDFNFHFDRWSNIWIYVFNNAPDSQVTTRLAADMLTHHLGGGQHSEMYGRFRVESPAAYNATADYYCGLAHTCITSFLSVNKKVAVDALRYLVERGQRFAEEGIDSQQRENLHERTRRWWEMRMESHFRLAEFLASEAIRPEGTSMVDVLPDSDFLQATSEDQFNAAARQLFDPRHRKIFVGGRIGPLGRWRMRRLS